jgi:hypothetical protein
MAFVRQSEDVMMLVEYGLKVWSELETELKLPNQVDFAPPRH